MPSSKYGIADIEFHEMKVSLAPWLPIEWGIYREYAYKLPIHAYQLPAPNPSFQTTGQLFSIARG